MRIRNKRKRCGVKCELPYEITGGGTRITLHAKQTVLVEGHHGILKIGRSSVCFKTDCGAMTVEGSELRIQELSLDSAIVAGASIESVAYKEKIDRGGDASGCDV